MKTCYAISIIILVILKRMKELECRTGVASEMNAQGQRQLPFVKAVLHYMSKHELSITWYISNNSTSANLPKGKHTKYFLQNVCTEMFIRVGYNSEELDQSKKCPAIQNWLRLDTRTMECHVVTTNYNRIFINNERCPKTQLNKLQTIILNMMPFF